MRCGRAEQSLRLIVDTIPGLVAIMTAEGEVELVNHRVLEYFGRTLEELKRWGTSDAVHPDDLPGVVAAWRRSVETAPPTISSTASGAPTAPIGGSSHAVIRSATRRGAWSGWYNLLTDIDERKQSEERLRRSEADLLEAQGHLRAENQVLREEIDHAFMFEEIVGSSPVLQAVLSSITKVAPTDSTVSRYPARPAPARS